MHDWTHHMITDAGVSTCLDSIIITHSRSVLTEGSEGLITSSRTAPDRYASVFLSRSDCTNLIQSDPLNLKLPDRIFLTAFLGFQMDTLHPRKSIPLKCLSFIYQSLLLIYWYDFGDACQRVALIRASADISLHLFTHL